MATRLYLRETTANTSGYARTEKSTALPVGLFNDSGLVARDLDEASGSSAETAQVTSQANTGSQSGFFRKFISAPLGVSSITAQTWTIAFAASEGNTNANARLSLSIYVLKNDDTVRGYVWDTTEGFPTNPAEWSTILRGQITTISGSLVSSVVSTDRLCLEMWYTSSIQGMATAYTQTISYNGTTTVVDGTNNSDPLAYLETPQNGLIAVSEAAFLLGEPARRLRRVRLAL